MTHFRGIARWLGVSRKMLRKHLWITGTWTNVSHVQVYSVQLDLVLACTPLLLSTKVNRGHKEDIQMTSCKPTFPLVIINIIIITITNFTLICGMISQMSGEEQLDIQRFESQLEIVSFEVFLERRKTYCPAIFLFKCWFSLGHSRNIFGSLCAVLTLHFSRSVDSHVCSTITSFLCTCLDSLSDCSIRQSLY